MHRMNWIASRRGFELNLFFFFQSYSHKLCVMLMFSDGDDYKQFFSLKAVFSCSIRMKLVLAEFADYMQREVDRIEIIVGNIRTQRNKYNWKLLPNKIHFIPE